MKCERDSPHMQMQPPYSYPRLPCYSSPCTTTSMYALPTRNLPQVHISVLSASLTKCCQSGPHHRALTPCLYVHDNSLVTHPLGQLAPVGMSNRPCAWLISTSRLLFQKSLAGPLIGTGSGLLVLERTRQQLPRPAQYPAARAAQLPAQAPQRAQHRRQLALNPARPKASATQCTARLQ